MTFLLRSLRSPLLLTSRPWGRRAYSEGGSFYDDSIAQYAAKPIVPLTLQTLLERGKPPLTESKILSSANFTFSELPARLARRVVAFQKLPFIVGTNPYIKDVHDTYVESFHILKAVPEIHTPAEDTQYSETLMALVDRHTENIPKLARGFQESRGYIGQREITSFFDDLIIARIGIRLIAEHHLALHHPKPDFIGVLHTKLEPASVVSSCARLVHDLCEFNYGSAPACAIEGDLTAHFHYPPVHLEYILHELLKNAFRATVERTRATSRPSHPPVRVTVSQGDGEIGIRIRDEGGGISAAIRDHIFSYSFTTVKDTAGDESINDMDGMSGETALESIFSSGSRLAMQAGVGGPMAGLGFGLPMAQIYAQYFGGHLDLVSLPAHGCDVFLRLPDIGEQNLSI